MTIYLLCLLYLRYYKIMKNGMNLVPVVIYYTLCVKCFMIFKSKSFIGSKCDLACIKKAYLGAFFIIKFIMYTAYNYNVYSWILNS